MPELAVVSSIATTLYQLHPQVIVPLAQHSVDWRGIYRLQDRDGHSWVLRLFHQSHGDEHLTRTAQLLEWLAHQHYPAPQVRYTTTGQTVGRLQGWSSLLLSFVEGHVLDSAAAELALLGQSIARLHALSVATAPAIAQSRCHPERIRTCTQQQLLLASQTVPLPFRPLVGALAASMAHIQHHDGCGIQLTHGDCWYQNAIKTSHTTATLIDWDAAGLGLPLLDIGYLLLSAHFNPARPFQIEPDARKVEAILSGYQQHYQVECREQELLLSAVRFPLAFHLGNYLEQHPTPQEDDSFVQKTFGRFQATEQLAQLAASYVR